MMRLLAGICAVGLAAPVVAEPVMTPETCRSGWHAFNVMIGSPRRLTDVQPRVNADSWCQIDRSFADLRDNDFAQVVWRATGVEAAVEKKGFPATLEAEFTGIDLIEAFGMDLPGNAAGTMGALSIKAMRDPDTRDFVVQAVDFNFAHLGGLDVAFSGGGIDLSSLQNMQLTLGGARLNALGAEFRTTPALSDALFRHMHPASATAIVSAIPQTSLDEDSRAAMMAFLDAGVTAEGTLVIDATSENGMGILQIVGGVKPLEDKGINEDTLGDAMEVLFSGVTLSLRWQPVE